MKIFLDIVKTIIAGLVMLSILILASGCTNWEVVECDHHHCNHHHHFDHHVDHHHYHHYTPRQIHYHEHMTKQQPRPSRPLPPSRPISPSSRPISKGVPQSSSRQPARKDD